MKKLFTILFLLPLLIQAQTFTNAVIPLTPADWYANDRISDISALSDGDLTTKYNPAWNGHVDTLTMTYDVPAAQTLSVTKIRIYDAGGTPTYPTRFYLRNLSTGVISLAGTWGGGSFNQWDSIVVSSPANNSQIIIKGAFGQNYGTEIQFVGNYTAYTRPLIFKQRSAVPLKNFFGVNSYWWNYQEDEYNNPGDASRVIDRKFARVKNSFGLVRFFADIDQFVPHKDQFALSPLRDGWRPDSVFKRNQDNGITTLLCLQGNTGYQRQSFVSANYGDSTSYGPFHDYDPLVKSDYANRENPATYKDRGQAVYAIAAKFGNNASADVSVFNLWDEAADGKGYYAPQSKGPGLGTLHYMSFVNEAEKFWKGDSAYLWGRALAALYSAGADGHKGALGAGVGVWNADPSMKIVFSAFAVATVDQLRGAIDWCIENRGYKPDGSVDVPWNVIDYHKYSTDASDQYGNVHTGTPVEMSDALTAAKNFVYTADRYLNGMPVWISEHGYDTSQTSPVKAHPVGSLNKLQVQGAWLVRSAFEYASLRMQGAVVFQLFDDSQNPAAFSTQYETSGLFNQDSLYTTRPAADYFHQVISRFGNYYYTSRRCSYPRVDEYTSPPDSNMYYIAVPDSVGGQVSYKLAVPAGVTVTIRQLQDGQDTPTITTQAESGGFVTVTATEMPQFITVPNTRRYYAQQFSGTIKLGR